METHSIYYNTGRSLFLSIVLFSLLSSSNPASADLETKSYIATCDKGCLWSPGHNLRSDALEIAKEHEKGVRHDAFVLKSFRSPDKPLPKAPDLARMGGTEFERVPYTIKEGPWEVLKTGNGFVFSAMCVIDEDGDAKVLYKVEGKSAVVSVAIDGKYKHRGDPFFSAGKFELGPGSKFKEYTYVHFDERDKFKGFFIYVEAK